MLVDQQLRFVMCVLKHKAIKLMSITLSSLEYDGIDGIVRDFSKCMYQIIMKICQMTILLEILVVALNITFCKRIILDSLKKLHFFVMES